VPRAMPASGGGFGVDADALRRAASQATNIGDELATVRTGLDAALRTAQPVGLGVGAALTEMASAWDALLGYLAGQVTAAGGTLIATARAYTETDAHVAALISRIEG